MPRLKTNKPVQVVISFDKRDMQKSTRIKSTYQLFDAGSKVHDPGRHVAVLRNLRIVNY